MNAKFRLFSVKHPYTENTEELFQKAMQHFPVKEINAIAEMTLQRYTADLESVITGNSSQNHIFQGKFCSLTAC